MGACRIGIFEQCTKTKAAVNGSLSPLLCCLANKRCGCPASGVEKDEA